MKFCFTELEEQHKLQRIMFKVHAPFLSIKKKTNEEKRYVHYKNLISWSILCKSFIFNSLLPSRETKSDNENTDMIFAKTDIFVQFIYKKPICLYSIPRRSSGIFQRGTPAYILHTPFPATLIWCNCCGLIFWPAEMFVNMVLFGPVIPSNLITLKRTYVKIWIKWITTILCSN